MNTFFVLIPAVIALISIVACAAMAIKFAYQDDAEDLIQQAFDRDAREQMKYLEKSECSLLYNPTINSWGLVDGADKLIAAGHSVSTTLQRAKDGDIAKRVADDFKNAEAGAA